MTIAQVLASVLLNRLLKSSGKISLKTLQTWITDHSDRDRYGIGYSGNRLSRGPSNGYIEVIKKAVSGGFTVTATVYLDPRQGAAESKTWGPAKLDGALEKYFGRDQRVRVKI
jgi:hypothetical protein